MAKNLNWKAFEMHEEQSAYGERLFSEMTMGQRLERFFMMLEIRSELTNLNKEPKEGVYNLVKPCFPKK
ncbi:MAG: hypothetical protein R2813_03885 [Flavobacteriales bacterium]